MRITAGTVATALVMLGLLAPRAQGAGWVGPTMLPGATAVPQAAAVTRSGWLAAAVPGSAAGTEQVLTRDPGGAWTPTTVTGIGTAPRVVLALSERGDAVLAVGNAEHQVLVFGHAAGTSGFVSMGTVLPSGYMYGPLDALALENGTAAVTAGTGADLVLATGQVGGALSAHSVLPAVADTPLFPHLVSNPRGDALLLFADHAGIAERVDGLRRAPGGAFVPFAAPLDTLAGGLAATGNVISLALDDAGAAEITWSADTAGPVHHLRAGHLPAGATALSTPTGGRAVHTTVAGESIQGPIGAVPLPGDSGAGIYTVFTPPSTLTAYDFSHAGATGSYSAGTAVPNGPNGAAWVMPEPTSAGGLAVAQVGTSTVVALERHTDSTYPAGPTLDITGWSSISGFYTDGADSSFVVNQNGPKIAIFDDAPPVLAAPNGPATAVAGAPAAFSVGAGDASGPPAIGWTFGDGGTAAGASVSHTWSAPGTYTIGVTATDAVGQRSTQSRQIVVAPAPPAGDKTPPVLTHVKLSPSKVRRHKARTKLKLTLSEAAKVTVTVTAKVPGHRSGKKCKAGKKRHAKRCTATKTELTVHKSLAAGAGSITLKLRRSVPIGTHTVKVFATDAAGNTSKTTTLKLRVRR